VIAEWNKTRTEDDEWTMNTDMMADVKICNDS
jgi:hypothetical protein